MNIEYSNAIETLQAGAVDSMFVVQALDELGK